MARYSCSALARLRSPMRARPPWFLSHLNTSPADRKSTRLNSSHLVISYAVFCLKKKKQTILISLFLISNHSTPHLKKLPHTSTNIPPTHLNHNADIIDNSAEQTYSTSLLWTTSR